jgi:hypothetical protein
VGFVKRVGDDVQQRQGEERQSALEDHEAHLCDRRPSQRGLYRRLSQHHETAEQGREATDHDKDGEDARGQQHDIGEADQQKSTRIDDAGMKERRYGCGRFHDLGQPAVRRELG